jgi:hypothetical protein
MDGTCSTHETWDMFKSLLTLEDYYNAS